MLETKSDLSHAEIIHSACWALAPVLKSLLMYQMCNAFLYLVFLINIFSCSCLDWAPQANTISQSKITHTVIPGNHFCLFPPSLFPLFSVSFFLIFGSHFSRVQQCFSRLDKLYERCSFWGTIQMTVYLCISILILWPHNSCHQEEKYTHFP